MNTYGIWFKEGFNNTFFVKTELEREWQLKVVSMDVMQTTVKEPAPTNNAPSCQRITIFVVGSKRMGKIRSAILYADPQVDLAGIVNVDPAAGRRLFATYLVSVPPSATPPPLDPDPRTRTRSAPPRLQAEVGAVVCVPTPAHGPVICAATFLASVCHVFVEKPMAGSAGGIAELFGACASSGTSLCCGFQRWFDAAYVAARDAVASGRMGGPLSAAATFVDHPRPPPQRVSPIWGGGIYANLSATTRLSSCTPSGSPPPELAGSAMRDGATVVLQFRGGSAVATLALSWYASYGYN